MNQSEIEDIEIDLLLEAIFVRYGYDFRSYARASINRRVQRFLSTCGCQTPGELIPRLLRDRDFFSELACMFSIGVTEMFRDPFVYRAIREHVLPVLKTWPYFKVWHAGCASGEEVYSLAILLAEDGLYDRSTIYATDFNDSSLARGKDGIYELERMQEFTRSYQAAGGKRSFSDYYHAQYDSAVIDTALKDRVTFANHNLAADHAFGEVHLAFCRNVLIYFNQDLQNRALRVITESLVNGGFLCLGTKENLAFTEVAGDFQEIDRDARIYKKVARF